MWKSGEGAATKCRQRSGLNRRPTVYKTVALPLSYAGTPGRLTESANDSSYPFTSLRITKIHSAPEDHRRFTGTRKHSRERTRLLPAKVSDYWIAVLLLSQIF